MIRNFRFSGSGAQGAPYNSTGETPAPLTDGMTDNPETNLSSTAAWPRAGSTPLCWRAWWGSGTPAASGAGWAFQGFKSFRYDPQGPEHPAWLLESTDLPRIIPELDDFEGEAYERRIIPARVNGGWVRAQVYAGKYVD